MGSCWSPILAKIGLAVLMVKSLWQLMLNVDEKVKVFLTERKPLKNSDFVLPTSSSSEDESYSCVAVGESSTF